MENYDFDGRPMSVGAAFLEALKKARSLKVDPPPTDVEDVDYHGPEPTYGNERW